jgi:hypothetical protein
MTDARTPELARAAGPEPAGRTPKLPPLVFVGGTGRSGTHVVGKLIGNHPRFAFIPVEVRFHVEERGFPGLLDGSVSKRDFVKRLRGFWWKGFQTRRWRGMFRFVERDRFNRAVASFEEAFDSDPEGASRRLFLDLLWFRVEESGSAKSLVEQSCDTIAQAPLLARLFPEAKFIHVVRDGRDASASRVGQARLVWPRTRRQGLDWWEQRIRQMDAGARQLPPQRLLTMSLDELLFVNRRGLLPLCWFLGVAMRGQMWRFSRNQISRERANAERWRRGISERRAREFDSLYRDLLDRLEADGVRCVPLLRHALERTAAPSDGGPPPLVYMTGGGTLREAPG